MRQYLDIMEKCLVEGRLKENRTGIKHLGYHGDMMQYNLQEGFPAVTTKQLYFRSAIAEMLGFLRGYTNAADFRKLGCKVWDDNANTNMLWRHSKWRKGDDDLGRIYGSQARNWDNHIDQLRSVYEDLHKGIDNRRELITHWNVSDIYEGKMALPPCHVLYQFGIQGQYLNMSMYQRSCDLPLGVPFNIAGYAWLLSVMARICSLKPGVFTHFMHDIHIYENQIELAKMQCKRIPYKRPQLYINPNIKTLEDLETWVMPADFELLDYTHHGAIDYPFAV